ncbi:hypothetical protein [Christiangramia crocea]|uniref:Uncharacterized protein n=1 Tax=Christiangramia crocea TaxID=2904124 RepID=A0A9X1UYH1_9FLAO|nr:hypothetical protein [Gramella crocea]MCG9972594.1 hypothetical protein [Gramella crocea]
MSFSITYHRFFVVHIKEHTSNKPIRFLKFQPTETTRELLKKYQLIFRKRDDGFEIYYKTNEYANPALENPISGRLKFSFVIRITSFSLFSEYEPENPVAPNFYFDNLTSSGAISNASAGNLTSSSHFQKDDIVRLYPLTFSVSTPQNIPNAPTEWRLKKYFTPKDLLQTVNIDNPDSLPAISVRINDPLKNPSEYIDQNGVYTLEADSATPKPETVYLDDQLSGKSVHGILDLYWDTSQDSVPANSGKEFQINFKRK